jgi:Stage II sporulation protein E (SpoIIE)
MQGYVREIAFEIVCRSGTRLPVLVNSVLKHDAAGTPLMSRTAIFDVCGKGASAAVVTALARYTLRSEALRAPSPSAVLTRLHEALLRDHPDNCCTALFAALAQRRRRRRHRLRRRPPAAPRGTSALTAR